jgi:hypothetical protein
MQLNPGDYTHNRIPRPIPSSEQKAELAAAREVARHILEVLGVKDLKELKANVQVLGVNWEAPGGQIFREFPGCESDEDSNPKE